MNEVLYLHRLFAPVEKVFPILDLCCRLPFQNCTLTTIGFLLRNVCFCLRYDFDLKTLRSE